ncbi:hypothetical protein TRVL_09202 [Trypanosoma vivax]|nr:hypothetical protein TRVL_09202 [Trypanosoma vivax]
MRAQAAHIAAGIPKVANREGALREAWLKPINEVAHRRALEYYLRLNAKWSADAKVAECFFLPERLVHVRLAKAHHFYITISFREEPHGATVLQLDSGIRLNTAMPCGLKAEHLKRTRRCTAFSLCNGSGSLIIRCGRTHPLRLMLCQPKAR